MTLGHIRYFSLVWTESKKRGSDFAPPQKNEAEMKKRASLGIVETDLLAFLAFSDGRWAQYLKFSLMHLLTAGQAAHFP